MEDMPTKQDSAVNKELNSLIRNLAAEDIPVEPPDEDQVQTVDQILTNIDNIFQQQEEESEDISDMSVLVRHIDKDEYANCIAFQELLIGYSLTEVQENVGYVPEEEPFSDNYNDYLGGNQKLQEEQEEQEEQEDLEEQEEQEDLEEQEEQEEQGEQEEQEIPEELKRSEEQDSLEFENLSALEQDSTSQEDTGGTVKEEVEETPNTNVVPEDEKGEEVVDETEELTAITKTTTFDEDVELVPLTPKDIEIAEGDTDEIYKL